MRLLFVCPDMRTGGAERHWATLVPALRDRGIEAELLCLAGKGPFFGELGARGVPVEYLDLRRRIEPARPAARALACAATRPDAVVTRGVSGQLVGGRIARRAGAGTCSTSTRRSRPTAGSCRRDRTSARSRGSWRDGSTPWSR